MLLLVYIVLDLLLVALLIDILGVEFQRVLEETMQDFSLVLGPPVYKLF